MKTLALSILIAAAALSARGQAKPPVNMADALAQLQRASNAKATVPALDYINARANVAPSLQLFMGATAAIANERIEDAAFLFYVAQMRSRYDLVRFPPKATGADGPTPLLAALNQQIGAEVNPTIMRNPRVLAAVVKRVEAWTPAVPSGYQPGWQFTSGGKSADAQKLFTAQRTAFSKRFGGLSTLLNDPEYFAAFKLVQDYNFSTAEQMKDPARKSAKERAEAKMLEIERRKGIEGLFWQKK